MHQPAPRSAAWHRYAIAAVLALGLGGVTTAQPRAATPFANIHIGNFGKIDDGYYRGAQPEQGDYADLKALGVRTVIDLTRDGRAEEPQLVQQAGMHFERIPLTTTDRPSPDAVSRFLALVSDPANQPVFVHCQGGRHRTGAMTAVYRMTHDGWTPDRAYAEMKQFNFEGFPTHPTLKRFVYDYPMQTKLTLPSATDATLLAATK